MLSGKRKKKIDLALLLCLTCQPAEHFLRNIPRAVTKWDQGHDLHLSLPFAMSRSFSNCCPKHKAPAQAQASASSCTHVALAPGARWYLWRTQRNPSICRVSGSCIRFLLIYAYFHHTWNSVLYWPWRINKHWSSWGKQLDAVILWNVWDT